MYADDLILVCASLSHLQALVNICVNEFSYMGLAVNAKKCGLLRVGKKWSAECAKLFINDSALSKAKELRCMGVYLQSGNVLKFNVEYCKKKFYRAVNAILSCVGNKADIVVTLCNAQCLPILLYCSESMSMTKTEKCKLAHPYYRLFSKLFHTFNATIIKECQWYLNCLPPQYLVDLRTLKFYNKFQSIGNRILNILFKATGVAATALIYDRLNIIRDSKKSWRSCAWTLFSQSLGLTC